MSLVCLKIWNPIRYPSGGCHHFFLAMNSKGTIFNGLPDKFLTSVFDQFVSHLNSHHCGQFNVIFLGLSTLVANNFW